MVKRKTSNHEYVINAQNYSSQLKTLKNVIIFKFQDNRFLERIDVEKVEMINDEKWILNNGVKLEINQIPKNI